MQNSIVRVVMKASRLTTTKPFLVARGTCKVRDKVYVGNYHIQLQSNQLIVPTYFTIMLLFKIYASSVTILSLFQRSIQRWLHALLDMQDLPSGTVYHMMLEKGIH